MEELVQTMVLEVRVVVTVETDRADGDRDRGGSKESGGGDDGTEVTTVEREVEITGRVVVIKVMVMAVSVE